MHHNLHIHREAKFGEFGFLIKPFDSDFPRIVSRFEVY